MKTFQLFRNILSPSFLTALPFFICAQNVGIGTTSPEEKLHIVNGNLLISPSTGGISTTRFNPLLILRAKQPDPDLQGSSFGLDFEINSNPIGSIRSVTSAVGLPFLRISRSTPTAADLVVNSGGNVGIGTASPQVKLHIYNGNFRINHLSDNALIELQRGGENRGFIHLSGANGDNIRIGTYSGGTGSFIVRTNGADRLAVNSAGDVTIAASRPATGYKLSVGGAVICTELRVALTANWPDYVFNDNYPLLSLESVERHILQHKHLPAIPSSSQISDSGLHIGEMQRLQMEKIEELFLSVIALKKEITKITAENNMLKACLK